jgi:biopolymer transport protein ExbB/TolQ
MVAIPAVLLGNLLSGWSETIKSGMEIAALKITNLSRTERPAATAG